MSNNIMSTAPGGEGDQYEDAIKTVTKPHAKQSGTLANASDQTASGTITDEQASERGDQTAENIRYGQKISEEGFGGKTDDVSGEAKQDGYGNVEPQNTSESAAKTRKEQGYGHDPSFNIGA